MATKDKDPKLTKSGIIYRYRYPHINCTEEYIGELGRTFGDRYKEHLKAPSTTHLQIQGMSQGTLTHTPTHIHFRTPGQARMFFHSGQGDTGIDQEHQGSHVHQGE